MRRALVAGVLLLLVANTTYGEGPPTEPVWSHDIKTFSDVILRDWDDRVVALKPVQKQVLVIHFWATWCAPCVEELPSLDQLAGELAEPGVGILAVSEDRGGVADVRRFFEHRAAPAHAAAVLDPQRLAAKAMGITTLPTTVVIGCDGSEHTRLTGTGHWANDPDRALLIAAVRDPVNRCP